LLTGETDGYYLDFEAEPLRLFGRALAQGFAYQGEPSPYRDGRARGTRSVALPPLAFVDYLQNHDQIGNRALGERIAMLAMTDGRDDALRALTACVLLAPSPPLLFMGEEFAASSPFLYFCDHEGELGQAVARGRRAEFESFDRFADPAARERIPDPNAESSFATSQLDWRERDRAPHSQWLSLYTELLRRRRQALVPWLDGARSGHVESPAAGLLRITWPLAAGRRWHLLAYLADDAAPAGLSATLPGEIVYASHAEAGHLAPWSVRVALESP
jgi:maltooligosyltrehalose trehalohydrolase